MTYHWHPWTADGDRRILADESEWQKPVTWNREAERTGERGLVIVGSDVFDESPLPIQVMSEYDRSWISIDTGLAIRDVFELIDDCHYLDWMITTSEPGRVTKSMKGDLRGVEAVRNFRNRSNLILSTGPIRTQADADRLVPELLKLRDLCGGCWITASPNNEINMDRWWMNQGPEWLFDADGMGYPPIGGLILTGGIPEHCDSLAAQCRAAGVVVVGVRS